MKVELRNFKPIDSERLDNMLRSLITHRSNLLDAEHACKLMEQSLNDRSVGLDVCCDAKVEARLARQHLVELYMGRIMYIIGDLEDLLVDCERQLTPVKQSSCHNDN